MRTFPPPLNVVAMETTVVTATTPLPPRLTHLCAEFSQHRIRISGGSVGKGRENESIARH